MPKSAEGTKGPKPRKLGRPRKPRESSTHQKTPQSHPQQQQQRPEGEQHSRVQDVIPPPPQQQSPDVQTASSGISNRSSSFHTEDDQQLQQAPASSFSSMKPPPPKEEKQVTTTRHQGAATSTGSNYEHSKDNRQAKQHIDPIQHFLFHHVILSKIFSEFSQKECMTAMCVSKLWKQRMPAICPADSWKVVQLDAADRALERFLLHYCLGAILGIKAVIIRGFHRQQDLFSMLRIVSERNCIAVEYYNFIDCTITDPALFMEEYFYPISQRTTRVEFHSQNGKLPIHLFLTMCPSLAELIVNYVNERQVDALQQRLLYQPPPQIPTTACQTLQFNIAAGCNLRSLCIGIPGPRRLSREYQQQQEYRHGTSRRRSEHHINTCTADVLAAVIDNCPQLNDVILSCTGDNLAPIVIQALTRLSGLSLLALYYDLTPNHYDGALYALLQRHVDMGPKRSSLKCLLLNVADDTILDLVGRILTLKLIDLANGFQLATRQGILRFSMRLGSSLILKDLILKEFDLRPFEILNHIAHAPNLTRIDISHCDVEHSGYLNFLNKAQQLQVAVQTIYCAPQQQEVVQLIDPDTGIRLPCRVVPVDLLFGGLDIFSHLDDPENFLTAMCVSKLLDEMAAALR
ncbi:hypothetical protein BDB00DRAFT_931158 [Zychaea mexicana]|uniref:uncharacterized protein n=1 Tax=Zychaea mexicana TaxID=64656 RepID=UPI0022FE23C7|nr:uncharacterized protein BDB00DRAFT_931158 [Zychaea mexicana]KAI9490505.1 hypothetical protein BDB00DRAFT_931158 [Zychaea mexicana]